MNDFLCDALNEDLFLVFFIRYRLVNRSIACCCCCCLIAVQYTSNHVTVLQLVASDASKLVRVYCVVVRISPAVICYGKSNIHKSPTQ